MRFVTTAITSLDTAVPAAQESRFARWVGLAIVSLIPAVFWSVIIETLAYGFGAPLSSTTLAITGASIATFLLAVCSPLMLRNGSHQNIQVAARRGSHD